MLHRLIKNNNKNWRGSFENIFLFWFMSVSGVSGSAVGAFHVAKFLRCLTNFQNALPFLAGGPHSGGIFRTHSDCEFCSKLSH